MIHVDLSTPTCILLFFLHLVHVSFTQPKNGRRAKVGNEMRDVS